MLEMGAAFLLFGLLCYVVGLAVGYVWGRAHGDQQLDKQRRKHVADLQSCRQRSYAAAFERNRRREP